MQEVGLGEQVLFPGKEALAGRNPERAQHARLRLAVRLQGAVREDVPHGMAFGVQVARDEQPAMAQKRIALGAHHGHALCLRKRKQRPDAALKARIAKGARGREDRVHAAPAQLPPKPEVADAGRFQRPRKRGARRWLVAQGIVPEA